MGWNTLLGVMGQALRDTFGQSVTYRRKATGEIFTLHAIFDISYSISDVGGQIGANIAKKTLDIRLCDIGHMPPKQDDNVLIDGTSYQVKDVEQSTSGMMKAILREDT